MSSISYASAAELSGTLITCELLAKVPRDSVERTALDAYSIGIGNTCGRLKLSLLERCRILKKHARARFSVLPFDLLV